MAKSTPNDLISCLVVTGNRPLLLRRAIICYNNQSYPNRELVVVDDGETNLDAVLSAVPASELNYLKLPPDPSRTLGELRNISLDEAKGAYLAQWDDDDWYHPDRLAVQHAALKEGHDACCLSATLMHINSEEMSEHPYTGWLPDGVPGTIMHIADNTLRYPTLRRGEDSDYLDHWKSRRYVKLNADLRYLFIRCFHGNNTWGLDHFARRIRNDYMRFAEYLWCKYVRRDIFSHSNFKLDAESREALKQFFIDTDLAGLVRH